MGTEEALAYLEHELNSRIDSFRSRRQFYRRGTYIVVTIAAALAAATTALIGLGEIFQSTLFSAGALLSSAIVSVLTAWDGFFGHKQRWVQTNDTLMRLYELRSDINFQKNIQDSPLEDHQITQLYNRYMDILRQANEQWKDVRAQDLHKSKYVPPD